MLKRLWRQLREAGARHSASDQAAIDAIHDHSVAAGANCPSADGATMESLREAERSYSQLQQALADAVRDSFALRDCYITEVYPSSVVILAWEGNFDSRTLYQIPYTISDQDEVTLGTPVEVIARMVYEPVTGDSPALPSTGAEALTERVIDAKTKAKIPAADFAGKARSFPIAIPQDVADAAASIGRAGKDNYSADELKKRIIAIATRKGKAFTAKLPAAWKTTTSESAEDAHPDAILLREAACPLVERAVRADGTIPVRIIQPGWGTSGYYSPEVLESYGPAAFPAGTKMLWNHPTDDQDRARPEGDLNAFAGVLQEDARWMPDHPAGPGLYSTSKVFSDWQGSVDEMAEHIGLSIRAGGWGEAGSAEGRQGRIIQEIYASPLNGVDFVTAAGAGGEILDLFEAARTRVLAGRRETPATQEDSMTDEEAKTLREAQTENARLKEAQVLREARDVVATRLHQPQYRDMPDLTRQRLIGQLARTPLLKEGAIDKPGFEAQIDQAAAEELAYLLEAAGLTGTVRGVGAGATPPTPESELTALDAKLLESFAVLGMGDKKAAIAARGR